MNWAKDLDPDFDRQIDRRLLLILRDEITEIKSLIFSLCKNLFCGLVVLITGTKNFRPFKLNTLLHQE